jgi:hypothetical protein
MIDFAPFFRLAALILASVDLGHKPPAERTEDLVVARASKYADFINQKAPPAP